MSLLEQILAEISERRHFALLLLASATEFLNHFNDGRNNRTNVFFNFMPPNSYDFPVIVSQIRRIFSVSCAVVFNFLFPKIVFQNLLPSWILPTVPKIAVQENANFFFLKNDVRLASQIPCVYPKLFSGYFP